MTKVGFIGLGHMGAPMALNLINAGYNVKVHDLSVHAMNAMTEQGAVACDEIKTAVEDAEFIFTMLPAGEHVINVLTDNNGVLNHCDKNALIIDSSSIAVADARMLAAKAKDFGIAMLDAPVSGGVAGAKAGSLTFVVGGDSENFKRAKPLFEAMGKTIIHAGPHGNGQAAKICNNMLLGISMIGVCEAFTLAKKLGLDAQTLFSISSKSSGQCWSMTSYSPIPGLVATAPSNTNYKAGFSTDMMLKDLKLSQEAAQKVNASTPLGAQATALYSLFNNSGNGQIDFSGIIKMLEGNKI